MFRIQVPKENYPSSGDITIAPYIIDQPIGEKGKQYTNAFLLAETPYSCSMAKLVCDAFHGEFFFSFVYACKVSYFAVCFVSLEVCSF